MNFNLTLGFMHRIISIGRISNQFEVNECLNFRGVTYPSLPPFYHHSEEKHPHSKLGVSIFSQAHKRQLVQSSYNSSLLSQQFQIQTFDKI